MEVITIDVSKEWNGGKIRLGLDGENLAEAVDFLLTDWLECYGSGGSASLAVKTFANELQIIDLDIVDGVARWTVTSDFTQAGLGEAQLTYKVGRKVKKSEIYQIAVGSSLRIARNMTRGYRI